MTWCQSAMQVPAIGDDPGLVQRDPFLHAVVKSAEHDRGVVSEPIRDFRIEPTAAIVECGGEIPMIERDQGLDSILEKGVDKPVVEIEPRGINRTITVGQNPA